MGRGSYLGPSRRDPEQVEAPMRCCALWVPKAVEPNTHSKPGGSKGKIQGGGSGVGHCRNLSQCFERRENAGCWLMYTMEASRRLFLEQGREGRQGVLWPGWSGLPPDALSKHAGLPGASGWGRREGKLREIRGQLTSGLHQREWGGTAREFSKNVLFPHPLSGLMIG